MSILSMLDWMASLDSSAVAFDKSRCLHSVDSSSACRECENLCPSAAIHLTRLPWFDEERCVGCGACLTACPAGAYSENDLRAGRFNPIFPLHDGGEIDLVCSANPRAEIGPGARSAGLRTPGCLAGVGVGSYVALAGHGAKRIVIRLDHCPSCPRGQLGEHIRHQVEMARGLLSLWSMDDRLVIVEESDALVPRPLRSLGRRRSSLSRRDFLRTFVPWPREEGSPPEILEDEPRDQRSRLLRAVETLAPPAAPTVPLAEGLHFASVTVSEACTGCLACVRVCPVKAIRFTLDRSGSSSRLTFHPRLCIGCEACRHVCAYSAITIDRTPAADYVFGARESLTLWEQDMTHCERCQALFPGAPGKRLCPTCEARLVNPFAVHASAKAPRESARPCAPRR